MALETGAPLYIPAVGTFDSDLAAVDRRIMPSSVRSPLTLCATNPGHTFILGSLMGRHGHGLRVEMTLVPRQKTAC